jgi:hypothetical protein
MYDKKYRNGTIQDVEFESIFVYGTGVDMIDDHAIFKIAVDNFEEELSNGIDNMDKVSNKTIRELISLIEDAARLCMDDVYVGITKLDRDIIVNKEAAINLSNCTDDIQDDPGFGVIVYIWGDITFWITGVINQGEREDSDYVDDVSETV